MHNICVQPVNFTRKEVVITRGVLYTPTHEVVFNDTNTSYNSRIILTLMHEFTQHLSAYITDSLYLLNANLFTLSTVPIIRTKR